MKSSSYWLRNKKHWLSCLVVLVCLAWLLVRFVNPYARPGHTFGVEEGQLAPCPDSPNCVSTQTDNPDQQMQPLATSLPAAEAIARLTTIINALPTSEIVSQSENYLHAEFRSLLMNYVDDVEFYVDEQAGIVHFRSASRVGYSDLGVNRARMESIRERFEEK